MVEVIKGIEISEKFTHGFRGIHHGCDTVRNDNDVGADN